MGWLIWAVRWKLFQTVCYLNAFTTGTLHLGWTHWPLQFSSQNRAILSFLSTMAPLLSGWPQQVPPSQGVSTPLTLTQGVSSYMYHQNECHQPLWKVLDKSVSWWTSARAPAPATAAIALLLLSLSDHRPSLTLIVNCRVSYSFIENKINVHDAL